MKCCDVQRCGQCSGEALPLSCGELFERLLVLDYGRQPPWGPLHAVAVACFFLQHPRDGRTPVAGGDVQWAIVQRFLTGGMAAVNGLVAHARSANSHRHPGRTGPMHLTGRQDPRLPQVPAPERFDTTIADVAVDGSFPSAGYENRVRMWAHSTVTAWTASADPSQ